MRHAVVAIFLAALALAACSGSNDAAEAERDGVSASAPVNGTAATNGNGRVRPDQVLVDMFRWWNDAYNEDDGFTAENFARYYTEDAVMLINGNRRGTGPAELAAHFRNIKANSEEVEIMLPFLESFNSGDRTFTAHYVRSIRGGPEQWEHIMGYAVIRDGRIALINFVGVPADAP